MVMKYLAKLAVPVAVMSDKLGRVRYQGNEQEVFLGHSVTRTVNMATDNHITYYQRLLQRNPLNPRAYYGLGDALIRKARETGDPSYFNRAEEALKKSLEINPDNAGAMRHLAYVFYSRHEFEPAAVHAGKAIEMDATDGDAYGILGDALMETGEYEKAEAAYGKMMQLEESLYSYSRRAGMKSMCGDSAGAMDDLERAVAAGKAAKQPAESIAWAEWQLGNDQFTLGKLAKAAAFYRRSLATHPNYYRALAGMFGGHGLYRDETFFGILHKGKLYFKVDESTIGEYRKRKMKPFRPNVKQTLKNYYQVPVEIIEDGDRLGAWAEAAIRCQGKKG